MDKDKIKKEDRLLGMCSRALPVSPSSINEKERTVQAVITTEKAAIVVDWDRWEMVREVLLMDGVVLPETRQIPLLESHRRMSTADAIGNIRNLKTENDALTGEVYFWSKAEDEFSKVKEGIITDLSAGYRVSEENTVELRPGEKKEINGRTFENNYGDNKRLLIRTQWEIKEGSAVVIGADSAAKFRSEEEAEKLLNDPVKKKNDELEKKVNQLNDELKEIKISFTNKGEVTVDPTKEEKTQQEIAREDAPKIIKYGKERFKGEYAEIAQNAVMEGKTFADFERSVFDQIEKSGGASEIPAGNVELSKNEIKQYDLAKAVRLTLQKKDSGLSQEDRNCFEFEVSEEIAKNFKGETRRGDFYVPNDVLMKGSHDYMQRAHSAGTDSEGGYLVATDHRPDIFVDMLRNSALLGKLGITILSGLKGDISIPKQLTGTTFAAVAENTAASMSYTTFGQVQGTPKTGSAYTKYGRQLLLQSTPGINTILMNDLIQQTAIGVDNWGINGTGSSNQPTGLMNQSGVNAVTPVNLVTAGSFSTGTEYIIVSVGTTDFTAIGASANTVGVVFTATGAGSGTGTAAGDITWQDIVSARKAVLKDNAMALGNPKWAMSADVEEQCLIVEKFSSTGKTLMDEVSGKMLRAPSEVSNQIDDAALIYGIWNQLYMLEWGVTEILVDPYSSGSAGEVELTIFKSVDFILRQASAFAINSSVRIAA